VGGERKGTPPSREEGQAGFPLCYRRDPFQAAQSGRFLAPCFFLSHGRGVNRSPFAIGSAAGCVLSCAGGAARVPFFFFFLDGALFFQVWFPSRDGAFSPACLLGYRQRRRILCLRGVPEFPDRLRRPLGGQRVFLERALLPLCPVTT